MSDPIDDIVNTFGMIKKLATGETSINDLGEAACGSQGETIESCPNPGCALAANHVPPCKAVRPT